MEATYIKPIELSESNKAMIDYWNKQHQDLLQWCRDNLGISQEREGTPEPRKNYHPK